MKNRRGKSYYLFSSEELAMLLILVVIGTVLIMYAIFPSTQLWAGAAEREPDPAGAGVADAAREITGPEIIGAAAEESAVCADEYLGDYTLTAYCACAKCCGKTDGITATGTLATAGRTIAVDPGVIPYGSRVLLIWPDGTQHEYIAEDCGSGVNGRHADVFFESHEAARQFGVQHAAAYLRAE